jgi:hypothetical protein
VPRQHHEAARGVRERREPPSLGGHIGAGERGFRHRCPDSHLKVLPFIEEGGQVIRLRPHPRPPSKSIGLIADLEGEELRADRARHIGSLSGRFLGRASRQIEPVDEPPPKRAQKTGEAIDC